MHADEPAQLPSPRRPSSARDRPSRTPFGPRRPKNAPDSVPDLPALPFPARPDSPSADTTDSAPFSYTDAAVQAPSTSPPSEPAPPSAPQRHAATTFIAPPTLTPPAPISFESTPIPWKGLPLEAAQWTFSSSELQEIVSRAIRLSARDSFVRLLSLQALEVDIARESERLEAARLEAQAKWRFDAGRRTMLMQALNAAAAWPSSDSEHADGANPVAGFVGQLASAIASCDSLLSTILQISDQQSQIALIQHQHWSSALGMALRKLNKAHERQGLDLKRAQARVQTLEDELDEAWREAEKMAIEFDDLEHEIVESEGSVIADLEDAVLEPRRGLDLKHDIDETGTLGDVTIHTDIAVVLGVTATAVASKATLVPSSANLVTSFHPALSSPPVPAHVDRSDTRSIRSVKSTRSRRSTRDGQTHLARLASARTRSRAASNASLRLPRALRSAPSTHASPIDAPPMPALPPASVPGNSFLDLDNIALERIRKVPPKRHPEPMLALPTPPHSASLSATPVPSIWLESDNDKPTRINNLERSQSLQIFSSLSPHKMRRSNLVMSLTGSDNNSDRERSRSPDSGSTSGSSMESPASISNDNGAVNGTGTGEGLETVLEMEIGMSMGTRSASPTSNHSPTSLPAYAFAPFHGPSLSSESHSTGGGSSPADMSAARQRGRGCANGCGTPNGRGGAYGRGGATGSGGPTGNGTNARPGSAGARLTTTSEKTIASSVKSPRKSLVSRASSVLLRRLSQATTGKVGTGGANGSAGVGAGASGGAMPNGVGVAKAMSVGGKSMLGSPSKSREATRLNGSGRGRWKDRTRGDEGLESGDRNGVEGEVILIGSPHADAFDAP